MHPLLQKFEGGDRRSIGQSEEVVTDVLREPLLFKVLIDGLSLNDPVVLMRASDALEKASLINPKYLLPYKKKLITLAAEAEQNEVR